MDEVQRYRWFAPSEAVGEEPARDGEWVRYTDHARRVAELESMLAQCFKLSGADPDGNEDWRLAPRAVEAVRELRKDYDDSCTDVCRYFERAEAYAVVLQAIRDSTFRNAVTLRSMADRALAAGVGGGE